MGKRKQLTWEDVSEEILKEYQELWSVLGSAVKMREWVLEHPDIRLDEKVLLHKRIMDDNNNRKTNT